MLADANGAPILPDNLPELGKANVTPIAVTIGGATVLPKYVKVDLYNNIIYLYLAGKCLATTTEGGTTFSEIQTGQQNLTITADVVSKEKFGLPAIRDFKGCVGVAKILLLK